MTAPLQRGAFEVLGRDLFLPVQFNPNEITLQKTLSMAELGIPGLDAPVIQFSRGQTETLTMDLFFDSTEAGTGAGAEPVTKLTDQFYQLLRIDKATHAPPICRFVWGRQSFPGSKYSAPWDTQSRTDGFTCVVESIRQRFTFFSPDGVPLRATLTVTLKEYRTLEEQIDKIGFASADRTSAYVIQEGDTLSRVAGETLENDSDWRAIADANGIDEPWALDAGRIVRIPATEAVIR